MDAPFSRQEPKLLYRRLDALLGSPRPRSAARKPLLEALLDDLFAALKDDLRLRAVLLYRERRDGYELVRHAGSPGAGVAETIPPSSPGLVALELHRTYLFASPEAAEAPARAGLLPAGPAAAILVGDPGDRYALFFLLEDVWDRDDVDFALNTLRAALGSRVLEERVRIALKEAAKIQQSLLVDEPPPFPGFDIAARSVPAEEVGGDFYDFIPFESDLVALAIGDASGHGLPAALLVRDVVTGLRMGIEKDLKMSYVFRKLNRVVHRSKLTSRFVSVFYGELEPNGNLIYVNAGHEPPFLIGDGSDQELATGGTVIGPLPEAQFQRGFVHVERGATLLLYTDGIPERRDAEGAFFGKERLKHLVRAHEKATAAELVATIFESARAFGGGAPWEDDATVVVVKRLAG